MFKNLKLVNPLKLNAIDNYWMLGAFCALNVVRVTLDNGFFLHLLVIAFPGVHFDSSANRYQNTTRKFTGAFNVGP